MRKFTILFACLLFLGVQAAWAQMEVKGKVTDAGDGTALPGVSIIVKGTLAGTVTDINGNYVLAIPEGYNDLIFSFVGMLTKEVKIDGRAVIDVAMEEDVVGLDEVVITALGISREKKSLGYATQEIGGDDINQVKTQNVISSLSGKAAGVQVRTNGNIGGSTNIIIRGSSSITGNNQALFVVDGVPISNDNTNNSGQLSGRSGYDYGNAAADINPNDIESINVLKGAAATALYGSRGANGVVLITTKKGTKQVSAKKKFGVNISSNVTTGFIDNSTFPKYQTNYGAGYGPYYGDEPYPAFEYVYDVDGDGELDYTVPTYEDASFGEKFDPSLMIYQYDSYDPASPNYLKKTPWVAGENGPSYFFETPLAFTNSIDITGGGDVTTFRLSYTNQNESGIMPNSKIVRNNFMLNGSYDILKNLTVTAQANFITTDATGRNSTGYSDNIMSSFRQWFQMNVDMKMQEQLYNDTKRNISWNPQSPTELYPLYWDNPYWVRYENFATDGRNRLIGYVQADWKITGWLSLMGRAAMDTYSEFQEERKAIGSVAGELGVNRPDVTSGYSRYDRTFTETNMDLILRFNKNLGESFNLNAFVGTNIRRTRTNSVFASTDGGLIVPGIYALSNSVNQMQAPQEWEREIGVNGIFAAISLGFKDYLFLDGTIRRDQSSTLPEEENDYWYPSVSASFLFSNLLDIDWMQLGKIRVGYAQVGNDAPWGSVKDTYTFNGVFSGTSLFSVPSTKNNPELKPERTNSIEAGLEMTFLMKRLGFDFAFYKNNTFNQIIPVAVSYATGYSSKYVNAGEVQNQGFELTLFGTPVIAGDFKWDIMLNWAKNVNEVVALEGDIQNLQLAALQGGVTINARVGEPYGTIQGSDFVWQDGQKVVKSNGYYLKSPTSDIVLGNINPDWNAGLINKFSYKNLAFSFLIDWQQGGSVFSLDLYYGLATGLYEETDYINDLGNPVRNTLEEGGGLILEGVVNVGTEENPEWVTNEKRVSGADYRVFGYSQNPNAAFVYDASYVKLREVVLSYSIPDKVMSKANWINGATFSLVGGNLWIISKNLPHADPEMSQSSGNVQGWQSGVMPATRNIGLTVNLQF
jgi:TonB-linked SusC/RagA family outer membrane protein